MTDPARLRREPPQFRPARVVRVEPTTPRLTRVTLAGSGLGELVPADPAASVRLLLPARGRVELEMPAWNGNEFLLPDGTRPAIRTLTPLRTEHPTDQLAVAIVRHGAGVLSEWAAAVEVGAEIAISGPGRGYALDLAAPAFVIAGDESALPAITQLIELIPAATPAAIHVEVGHADAELPLGRGVTWHVHPADAPPGDAMVAAVATHTIEPETRVWAAGEAAAVQRIRRHLFDELRVPRSHTFVRGYWKHGRVGTGSDE